MYGERRQLKTLGRYPALSLKEARRKALEFLGTDRPLDGQPANLGYQEAAKRFLAESEGRHKPQTTADYRRHLNFYGFQKPIRDTTRSEIMGKLATLANQPVTQNHTFDTISNFLNWAIRNEYVQRHPLQGERKPASKRHRERVLTEDELKAVFLRAIQFPFPYGHIVRLLILTGQRRSEILHLTWDRVGQTLSFPDTKNRTDHEIPLFSMAREIVESIPHQKKYLFENSKNVPFSAFSKAKVDFDKGLHGVAPYRLHDLRRTFSSNMAMLGVPLHVTERILNHKSGTISGVSAIYNRYTFAKEMKEALETYEAYIAKLIAPVG
jgi:integrase